ncbi:hypothetical protein [Xanthomonas cassavae]|uniref:hypothetical protein n=1 Tax=Xanthomonas cassavae TaxID=56450 RepID=UPI001F3A40F3|nr:hypothetical protein [Xanthomonas cassavae]
MDEFGAVSTIGIRRGHVADVKVTQAKTKNSRLGACVAGKTAQVLTPFALSQLNATVCIL